MDKTPQQQEKPAAQDWVVLLYYKFVPIDEPGKLVQDHKEFCGGLGLKGRVLIAREGINGTLGGPREAVEAYKTYLRSDSRFSDVEFKESDGDPATFPKLVVKVRKEIVTLGLGEDLPAVTKEGHLTPEQWKEELARGEAVLFDVRNRYEYDIGRFKGAIAPPIENFRELPAVLPQYEHLKDKKVLMYCTGGIRCEKAAALFKREGFSDVYQLHGGIVSYLKRFPGEHWEGECFVFDQRMTDAATVAGPCGVCAHTGVATQHFENCLHDPCHKLFLVDPAAISQNPDLRLCPECLKSGLTSQTADYKGSPARPPKEPKPKRRRKKRTNLQTA